MFPSFVDTDLQQKGYSNVTNIQGGENAPHEAHSYHAQKYRDRVLQVQNCLKDNRNKKSRMENAYNHTFVASKGTAQGSGNKVFFDNGYRLPTKLKGGVLSTPEGQVYGQELLRRRAIQFQQLKGLAETPVNDKSNIPTPQPTPFTTPEFLKLRVSMLLNDIIATLREVPRNFPEALI